MRAAFFLILSAVLYLSLFPGHFDWSRPFLLVPPFRAVQYYSDVVDVIVNVPFYIPLGFTAVAAWTRTPGLRAVLGATLFCGVVSYSVEILQQFILPRRFSNSRDVLLNVIGAAIGAWLATQPRWRRWNVSRLFGKSRAVWWLLSLWWIWLAFPFFPNMRYVQLRRMWEHSLEEFGGAGLPVVEIAAHFVGALVLACLPVRRRSLVPALALLALFYMPLIYGLRFSPSRVAATLAGFALAHLLRLPQRTGWLLGIVGAWAAIYVFYYGAPGLAPYDTTWEVSPALARESWRTPIRDLAGKLFIASAVTYSIWRARR